MTDAYCTCNDHIDFAGEKCPDCGLDVNQYGNTEDSFQYCSFPDCGCDGARLCMAGEPSDHAARGNVEGMWRGKTREQRHALFDLVEFVNKNKADD